MRGMVYRACMVVTVSLLLAAELASGSGEPTSAPEPFGTAAE